MHSDRRVARAAFAAAAVAIGAVVAFTGHDSTTTDRRQAARELVALAAQGDRRTYRADYVTTRRRAAGSGLSAVVRVWVRAQPALDAEEAGGQLTVASASGVWVCTRVAAKPSCLQQATTNGVHSAAAPYAVAIASGRYDVSRAAGREISGETARCFTLRVHATAVPITGLGTRLDACFAPDGVPLFSRVEHDGVVDERRARQVRRGLPAAELRALGRDFTDGSVPVLAPR